MNGVEVTQKIFRTIPHCSSKPSVFHRWVFYFTKMAKEIQLTQGKVALVDDEDYDYLNQFNWHACKIDNTFYAYTNIKLLNGKFTKNPMHRIIMNPSKGYVIDHVNHCTLDNRKINLRICTVGENIMNRRIQKNNICGYKGVHFCKKNNKYKAEIKANKKKYYLGSYISINDAARAYNYAALKYHGEFAQLNILPEENLLNL